MADQMETWTDGFETGAVAGAMHQQKVITDTLIDSLFLIVGTFGAYMIGKGIAEFATERWNAERVNLNDPTTGE